MKAIVEKKVETVRNENRRPGEGDLKNFSVNSRTIMIRLFGIVIYKKWETYKD